MRFKILRHGGYGSTGLSTTGGNMTGPLVLAGSPSQPLEASTKGYVDTALGNLNGASLITGLIPVERLPAFTGDIVNVAGSNSFALTDSGITPGSYPRVTVNAKGRITNGFLLTENDLPALDWNKVTAGKPTTMAGYGITDAINPSGGVMTGMLVVNNDPTSPLHVATKGYIDNLNAGSAGGSLKTGDLVRKVTSVTPAGFLRCNGGDVSKTTYAALYAVIGDTYTASNIPGIGRPWDQQYDMNNSDQTVPLAFVQGEVGPSVGTGNSIYGSYVTVTKNRVFVFGGNISGTGGGTGYTQTVSSAPINADGSLGTFVATTGLPSTWALGSAVVTKNRVYIIGGVESNNQTTNIYYAPINADGTLGTWTNAGNLPTHMRLGGVVAVKNRLYHVGGYTAADGYSAKVYTCVINADGSLGAWGQSNSLPNSANYPSVAVVKDRIYCMGGYNGTSGNLTDTIFYAMINTDGTIGTWNTSTVRLPTVIGGGGSSTFVTRKEILSIQNSTLIRMPINADGSLGNGTVENLPISFYGQIGFVTSSALYIYGNSAGNVANTYFWKAPFKGGQNDYSLYYSGTITATDPTNFRLPDFSAKEMPGSYTYVKY